MKIISGAEPLFCDINDQSYKILADISSTSNDNELMQRMRHWMPLNFDSMVHLSDWKEVLNKIDHRLSTIMNTWRNDIALVSDNKSEEKVEQNTDREVDMEDLKCILLFTSELLKSSINKEVYNSTEYLIELMGAYDDELVTLTLDTLLSLALPPLSHRCNLDMTRHITSLHRNLPYFDPIFEVIESSFFTCSIPLTEFLSDNFIPTTEMRKAHVNLRTHSKFCKNIIVSDSNGQTQELDTYLKPENSYEINDVWENKQDLKDILLNNASKLSYGLKFSLMFTIRMKRMLKTRIGRQKILKMLYQATTIVLGCHPDATVLSSYFEDKITLIKNFMYLLRTGPGSLDYSPELLPLDVRLLACQCLEAIVGSRDSSSTPIFARYPWIVQDLGLNRGQYMGLLPCLVRSMTSYLVSLDTTSTTSSSSSGTTTGAEESKMDVVTLSHSHDSSNSTNNHNETAEEREIRLLWIENVFMLLIAIINISASLPALTDNGLISAVLLVLERENLYNREGANMFVEIMSVEILEGAVTSHSPAMAAFKEKGGMEIVIDRLHRELVHCLVDCPPPVVDTPMTVVRGSNGTLPAASSILIQEFFSLLTSVLQEDRSHSTDREQWYKLPALTEAIRLILANAHIVGSLILSPAISLLAEIINSDPAPPTILSHMLNTGVAKGALRVLTGLSLDEDTTSTSVSTSSARPPSQDLIYSSDLMLSMGCLMSSLSLTKDGSELITTISPFKTIFGIFYDPRNVYPQSRVIMSDLPNMLGTNLEELARHYPVYATPMLTELVSAMQKIVDLAEPYIGTENYKHGKINFTEEYEQVLHFAVAILLCLEPLLMNKTTIVEFHKLGGFTLLGKFLRMAFGPPIYLLDAFACTIDSTVSCIGYTPIIALVISRCMNRISEVERKLLLEYIMSDLQEVVTTLQNDLKYHSEHYKRAESLRPGNSEIQATAIQSAIIPKTLGGNANPFLEGFLDSVTRDPVQDCYVNGMITERLLSYTRILRGFALVDCLVDAVGIVLNQRVTGGGWDECWTMFSSPDSQQLVELVLSQLYIPTQLEMARARGMFMNSTKDSCVKVHPVYHLLVVAADHVVVKDTPFDDTGKVNKVCKLGRGCTVEAYERKCVGTNNSVLKYRTKLGWISVFKNNSGNNVDPQILVIRTSQKTEEDCIEEIARNQDTYSDAEKRFDFEKFANISAKRGGFLALYHFNHSVKMNLLTLLSKNLFIRESGSLMIPSEICNISTTAVKNVPMLIDSIRALIPDIPNSTPKAEFDLEGLLMGTSNQTLTNSNSNSGSNTAAVGTRGSTGTKRSRFARGNAAITAAATTIDASSSVEDTSRILKETYFQQDTVPLLDEFPTSQVYISIRLAELANSLVFEHRRGRLEMNPLLMAHLLYGDYLEKLFYVAGKIFLCSFPDLALETEDKPEHHRLYSGKWYPLKESDLDKDSIEPTDSTSSSTEETLDTSMQVENTTATTTTADTTQQLSKPNKGKGKAKKGSKDTKEKSSSEDKKETAEPSFTPFPSYLTYRRALRERRLLAISSIDNTLNLWKLLCSTMTPSVTSAERALQRDSTEERDYDPYAMRRLILTTMSKYLVQIWSHSQLHLLPPTTVKNVVDLMAVVIKALHDMKNIASLRAPAPTTTSSSSESRSSAGAEAQRFLNRIGGARRIATAESRHPSATAPAAAAGNEFVVSEDCIRTLEEMGFTRRAITRAATVLRSNNANHLVPHLLENPYYFNEPEPAAATRSSTTATGATSSSTTDVTTGEGAAAPTTTAEGASAVAATPTETATTTAGSTTTTRASASNAGRTIPSDLDRRLDMLNQLFGLNAGLPIPSASSRTAPAGRERKNSHSGGSADATTAVEKTNTLPLIPKQLDVTLKLERDLLQRVLKCIYGDVPQLCVRLIEHGPTKLLCLLDNDMKTSSVGVTRELFTVMVLNQMLKCLEKNMLPEGLLRIVQLSWMYRRAIVILKEGPLSEETFSTLYGLLHAILVLLTSKVNSGNNRQPVGNNELLFLIFTLDDRYNQLYPLLVEALERCTTEAESSTDGLSTVEKVRLDWIAPALLILDLAAQPILVDSDSLQSHITDLDGYVKYEGQAVVLGDSNNSSSSSTKVSSTLDNSILSEQVRQLLRKTFLNKKSALASHSSIDDMLFNMSNIRKSGRSFDGIFDFHSNSHEDQPDPSNNPVHKGKGKNKTSFKSTPNTTTPSTTTMLIEDTKENLINNNEEKKEFTDKLPLFENSLNETIKMRGLKVSLTLLKLITNRKTEETEIPQAVLQFIVHLTRLPELRKEFHNNNGGILILRCKSYFDGIASIIFTLLQQILEDEKCLIQAMITAVRLCLMRLSQRKAKNVPLKNFMEVICPVVFRQQALFMKVLKEHTILKNISGTVYITWKDIPNLVPVGVEAKMVGNSDELAVTGLERQTSTDSTKPVTTTGSAAKRQRLQDGTAAVTSNTQSASKTPTAATSASATATTPASGLKSGSKRVATQISTAEGTTTAATAITPSASAGSSSAVKTPYSSMLHNEAIAVVMDELLSRIVCKWLQIRSMDQTGATKLSTEKDAVDTSLSIAEMLIIASDLIAAQPAVSVYVLRYCFNVAKVPVWAKEIAKTEFPLKHVLTGQPLGGLFITFVVHALLMPAKLVSFDTSASTSSSTPALSTEAAAKQVEDRNAVLNKLTGTGLRNACSYFLASLASRPGDSRKRVLNEVLQGANVGNVVINRSTLMRSLVAFAETLQYLLSPPPQWVTRDAFIVPAKDILSTLTKLGAHARLSAAICALDMTHPLALETVMVLSVPLDNIIKKGLEPIPATPAITDTTTKVVASTSQGATRERTGSSSSTGGNAQELTALPEPAAATAPTTASGLPPRPSGSATRTPNHRRSSAGNSNTTATTTGGTDTAGRATTTTAADTSRAFTTPALNRRRGNTDQSLDTEERMLLLGDQHEHLIHPADYRHHDEDSEGGYDQDEIDGDAAVQEYLDAEGIVDGGDDYDDDDDEDPGSDDDDEDGDEDESDEDGPGHHHHHHHNHALGEDESGSDSDGEEDSHSQGMHSHSEGDHSSQDDDEDDMDESDDDDDVDMDESRDYPIDEDDEDDGEESDEDEVMEQPELEIAVEIEEDSQAGEEHDQEEEDGVEEIDDFDPEDDESIDSDQADPEEELDEGEEGEHQIEPEDEGEEVGAGAEGMFGEEEEDMEFTHEEGEEDMEEEDQYDNLAFNTHQEEEADGDADEDGAGLGDEENFWAQEGRIPTTGLRSRNADQGDDGDDEFMSAPRPRGHDRSRRVSINAGGMAHPLDLGALIRDVQSRGGSRSGVFRLPPGAMLAGGVLETQNEDGPGETISFGQDGGITSRNMWTRNAEGGGGGMQLSDMLSGGGNGLASFSANFQDFVQNMLPPNMSMTSSTARVDPRTGALTLSFGGTRNTDGAAPTTISGGGGGSSANALGATAIQPPAHPLLTVTDARRNRFLQPCVNGLAVAFGGSGRHTSLTQRMAGLSALTGGSSSTLDASNRRGQLSVRRREVGPIVSDRRWGTDIGDLEPAGARLAALTTAVETALSDVIEKEPLPESRSRSTSIAAKSVSSSQGRNRSKSGDRDDWLAGLRSLATAGMSSDGEAVSPPALGGVHHESDDDNGEESDGSEHGSDDAEARNAARRRRFGFDPSESKEDEGELQETKEDEPASSTAATTGSSSQPPATTAEAPTSAMEVEAPAVSSATVDANTTAATTVETAAPSAMEVVNTPSPSTATTAGGSATAAAASVEPVLSTENLQFLDSLSPELRQEVLLTAEDEFLQSLPAAVQQEAHALRVEMGMEEPVDIATTVATTAPAAASTSNTAAAPAIDFATIMETLQRASAGSAAAPAASREAPASVPSSSSEASHSARLLQLLESTIAAPAPVSGSGTGTAAGSSSSSTAAAVITGASNETTAAAPQSNTGRAAAIAAVASRKTADLTMVTLGEDRSDDSLPYGPHLIARLLRSFITVNRSKLPRSLSKLIATACRYKHGRVWILRALLACLTHDGHRVSYCLRKLPLESESQSAAFDAELAELEISVQGIVQNQLNVHRIITGLSFLLRRTDRLAWYDFMLRPEPEEDSVWLFGSLIELLGDKVLTSGENLEYVLQILEELCGVFSKLTVKQANELAAESQRRLDATRKCSGKGLSVTYAPTTAALETIAEGDDEEPASALKRRRLEPATPDASAASPGRARAASIDIQAAAESATGASTSGEGTQSAVAPASQAAPDATSGSKGRCRIPFPVLQETEAKLLCQIAGSVHCNGSSRKRLMRVMRYLSLCDSNWMLFLDQMAHVGADLASRATLEFSDLHNTLVEVAQHNESAATAMARPELSTPKSLSEVRLLNVLRIMSALRSRSSDSAAAESEVVASRMRRIQAGKLWDTLCDCLDIVRDLEGIVEVEEVEPPVAKKNSSAHSHMHKMEQDKKVALSSLTMRFMPLIECFLSVCATTMLVRPDSSTAHHAMNEAQRELERMSSGFKRRHSRDEAPPSASRSNSLSGPSSIGIAGRLSPMTPAGTGHHDLTSPASITRVNSMLPGSRFRQHASYFQMQMELTDETAAQRLITFVKQNRVLFNNVLRNNVSLLEASFSPLVNVPKCRQLLHFDIKRAYFKLKLKRMRQSAARAHGALRLSVRRSGVFEESFQALRYKTADEMRRRLSVNFHGEEGMDAGGLTREWYGVLAREIFNPNYALFTSAGDNVTFQPNAQSYINPDHQSYFKFVGRVIGKAICDGQLLDAHFTRSFYKHILGLPVSVVDLEAIDPEYFKSLKQILNTPLDLLGLDLTFSAESNDFGVVSTVDLIPQGRDVDVTDDTKHEYVKLLAHHRMTTAIRKQIDSFLEGFHELVPSELVSIFDAQELELLISGLPDIDLDDLRAYTDYQGYKPTDPQITHFWAVLKAFSTEEKALFLQFVTGTSKVPLDGFKALQGSDGVKHFNIQKAFGGSHLLPSAHTCFNQLDLPEYPTEEVLREKLLIAIREGSEGFGFA